MTRKLKPDERKRAEMVQYSDDVAEEVCERLSEGETLTVICRDAHLPARKTVYHWVDHRPHFKEMYDEARDRQADAHADEILLACELPDNCTSAQVNAARLKVDALKWTAEKLRPARYGERMQQTLTVDVSAGYAALLEEIDSRRRPMLDVTPSVPLARLRPRFAMLLTLLEA